MVKGCTFGKNAPDKFVGDFTAAFLVRTLRIAIEDSASYLSKFSAFNGNWVGKFTASVRQNDGKQSAVLLVPKSFVQPFKNLRNRPCRVWAGPMKIFWNTPQPIRTFPSWKSIL